MGELFEQKKYFLPQLIASAETMELAMKVLEPVMLANPKDPDVFYNMAVVLVRLPEVDPHREIAAKYYTKSIELGGRRSLVLERRLEME